MKNLLVVAGLGVLAAGCIPDAEPDLISACKEQFVSYDQASETLKTPLLEDALAVFGTLAGRWQADIVCPPDDSEAKHLEFSLNPDAKDAVQVVEGCLQGGELLSPAATSFGATAHCSVSIDSLDFKGIDQQAASFDVAFLTDYWKVEISQFLDPSYDPNLRSINMAILVGYDNTLAGGLTFAFKPQKTPEGNMSMSGYDCEMTNIKKVGI